MGTSDEVGAERERCAKIAHDHVGSAARKRRASSLQFKVMSTEERAKIEAEERGEDIAAGVIELAIRGG